MEHKGPLTSETVLKWLGAAVALAGAITGIFSYRASIANSKAASEREYQKPFYDRQMTLYFDASRAAATLASSRNPNELRKASERFWQLYWGELCIVEDQQVESKMRDFGIVLSQVEKAPGRLTVQEQQSLRKPSYDLAQSLRDSLSKAWPVPGKLRGLRQ
jgi:hypothetical protein